MLSRIHGTSVIKMWLAALCLATLTSAAAIRAGSPSWTFTSIDVPGASLTVANDVNEDGDIVGYFYIATVAHGFLLSEGVFTTIDFPGATLTGAFGINSRGDIVGLYQDASGFHGFLLRDGSFTSIDVPGATYTEAWGINDRGDITGDYDDDTGKTRAFLLTKHGELNSLDPPFAFNAALTHGVNSGGDTIVGCWWDDTWMMHSLIVTDGEYITNDFPGSVMSMNWRVNPAGRMVGHYTDTAGRTHGYLYAKGTHTSIDYPDAIATQAKGINASGEIVGQYRSPDRRWHGFLLSKD